LEGCPIDERRFSPQMKDDFPRTCPTASFRRGFKKMEGFPQMGADGIHADERRFLFCEDLRKNLRPSAGSLHPYP
jgi:hypothetical protein